MDNKTAVGICRSISNSMILGCQNMLNQSRKSELNEIANLIEQQDKLAELGRLALQTQPCYYEYQYNDGDCHMEKCSSCELCRVRSEMLRGKV